MFISRTAFKSFFCFLVGLLYQQANCKHVPVVSELLTKQDSQARCKDSFQSGHNAAYDKSECQRMFKHISSENKRILYDFAHDGSGLVSLLLAACLKQPRSNLLSFAFSQYDELKLVFKVACVQHQKNDNAAEYQNQDQDEGGIKYINVAPSSDTTLNEHVINDAVKEAHTDMSQTKIERIKHTQAAKLFYVGKTTHCCIALHLSENLEHFWARVVFCVLSY